VGCHACVVACSIENRTEPATLWREITPFNPTGYPGIPLFHFSLACNHCADAPCMKNCPAQAYSRDILTGAVMHHPEKCIGCQYCTWACPYDAPKFNPKTRIVEKCSFCNHRISESLKPACANLCPTGALDFIDMPDELIYTGILGFTDIGIKPSIKIIPPRKEKPALICSETDFEALPLAPKKPFSKINLRHEWPLAVFTLIATLLVSAYTAGFFKGTEIHPLVLIISGGMGLFMSLFHLGKKIRAWRSIFGIKHSWLSREIVFFMLFLGIAVTSTIVEIGRIGSVAGIICGIIALVSIDMVYRLAIQATKLSFHSAHVVLSFILFTGLLTGQYYIFTVMLVLKVGLYIYRKWEMHKKGKNIRLFISAWRLDMLISFPLLFWVFGIPNIQWWIFASILIGEIIDRAEYYDELDIITPQKQILSDYKKTIMNV
jgi:Fe-S-cluster-containing dehydrogenase component